MDIGANTFSDAIQSNDFDFKYGEFTVFAPTDALFKTGEANLVREGYGEQAINSIVMFHIAANIIEDTLLDDPSKCGSTLSMLGNANSNFGLSPEIPQKTVTECVEGEVFQIGPGNLFDDSIFSSEQPPKIFGAPIEACNGVVYTIEDALILPSLSEPNYQEPSPADDVTSTNNGGNLPTLPTNFPIINPSNILPTSPADTPVEKPFFIPKPPDNAMAPSIIDYDENSINGLSSTLPSFENGSISTTESPSRQPFVFPSLTESVDGEEAQPFASFPTISLPDFGEVVSDEVEESSASQQHIHGVLLPASALFIIVFISFI